MGSLLGPTKHIYGSFGFVAEKHIYGSFGLVESSLVIYQVYQYALWGDLATNRYRVGPVQPHLNFPQKYHRI